MALKSKMVIMVRVPLIIRHRLDVVKSTGLECFTARSFLEESTGRKPAWLPQAVNRSAYRYELGLFAMDS